MGYRCVRKCLYYVGLGYIWERQGVDNPNCFIRFFTSLLHEINTQDWNSSVSDNKKLSLYKSVKNRFVYEDYFDVFNVRKSRYCYVNFRIESNVLGVELALYKNTPHELHFLLVCVTTIVLLDHHICPNITANILLYSK